MSEALKPLFFLTRQDGKMVPLIAMDELPPTVIIRGVARTVSPYDVAGMTGVGLVASCHQQYTVERVPQTEVTSLADQSFMSTNHTSLDRNASAAGQLRSLFQEPQKAYGVQEQHPSHLTSAQAAIPIDKYLRNGRRTTAAPLPSWHDPSVLPTLVDPATGAKEYCSYWLRHGECDYAQQGCLYRHEMPLDRHTLLRLGLRDIPRWYREKHAIGSYLAVADPAAGAAATKSPTNMRSAQMEKHWGSGSERGSLGSTHGGANRHESTHRSTSKDNTSRVFERIKLMSSNRFLPSDSPLLSVPMRAPTLSSSIKDTPFRVSKPIETLHELQERETVRELEKYEIQRSHERQLMAQRFKPLQPVKRGVVSFSDETQSPEPVVSDPSLLDDETSMSSYPISATSAPAEVDPKPETTESVCVADAIPLITEAEVTGEEALSKVNIGQNQKPMVGREAKSGRAGGCIQPKKVALIDQGEAKNHDDPSTVAMGLKGPRKGGRRGGKASRSTDKK